MNAMRHDWSNWLVQCPKCGYKRYDPIAESCERRQCGFEGAIVKATTSIAESASETNVTLSGIPDLPAPNVDLPPNVDVDAMIRAIDKLEACVARLKRFLMVDGKGTEGGQG